MNNEEKYNQLLKSERLVKRNKKKFNYRSQDFKCCLTCKNIRHDYDCVVECILLNPSDDFKSLADVHELWICDKYEPM